MQRIGHSLKAYSLRYVILWGFSSGYLIRLRLSNVTRCQRLQREAISILVLGLFSLGPVWMNTPYRPSKGKGIHPLGTNWCHTTTDMVWACPLRFFCWKLGPRWGDAEKKGSFTEVECRGRWYGHCVCVERECKIQCKKGLIFIKISEPNPRSLCLPVSCDSFVTSPFLFFCHVVVETEKPTPEVLPDFVL